MPSKKTAPRRKKRILWTPADLKTLRQHAGKKSVPQLTRLLKRSEAALRFKAFTHRISLKLKTR
jgi:hypothetical protein